MHPNIVEMVCYAKERKVARVVDIVSNGALLTKEMIDGLVAAGLDRIRISLQGLDADMYKDMSDVVIDFEQFQTCVIFMSIAETPKSISRSWMCHSRSVAKQRF